MVIEVFSGPFLAPCCMFLRGGAQGGAEKIFRRASRALKSRPPPGEIVSSAPEPFYNFNSCSVDNRPIKEKSCTWCLKIHLFQCSQSKQYGRLFSEAEGTYLGTNSGSLRIPDQLIGQNTMARY